MEEEDDLFVVIIENDKGEDGNFPIPIITKQEQLDETETKLAIEDILATAEKHGQFINIGSQSVCNEYEYLDDEDVSLVIMKYLLFLVIIYSIMLGASLTCPVT